jgi:F0F1-type ATP synthase assembly protein I
MTEPDNSSSSTRPISVAELLAKNGTIGAPPVGGRRRRRRGNADAVTVAELTGEIPIITDRPADADTREQPARDESAEETAQIPVNGAAQRTITGPAPEITDGVTDDVTEDVAEDVAQEPVETAEFDTDTDTDADDTDTAEVVERDEAVGAEDMSPDPLVDDDEEPADLLDPDLAEAAPHDRSDRDADELPSYLRSSAGPLFGGGTVADDLARRGRDTDTATIDERDDDLDEDLDERDLREDTRDEVDEFDAVESEGRMSAFLRGAWIVGQCIIAVAFGAGLFIAFDQLWKWNNIVALVLSVLVILGLVVGVRVVRKTEDIGSTLIAVAVGALVTLGPLALLQSG